MVNLSHTGAVGPRAGDAPLDTPHDAHRAGVVFLLDMMTIARAGRHPIDALLLLVIIQANSAGATQAMDSDTPDAALRPISINGLANSLRLPFESVRRRVRRLADEGECRIVREGVIVPPAVLFQPARQAKALQARERLRLYHAELAGLGGLGDLPPPAGASALADDAELTRVSVRILADYLLRVMDVAHASFGDLIGCLLLLEAFCANTEHLPYSPPPAEGAGPIRVHADHQRLPVRLAALARRSGFATETARRHAGALVRRGLLAVSRDGVIVPAGALLGPDVARFAWENVVQTRRMFALLAQAGVLAAWQAQAAAEAPALTA